MPFNANLISNGENVTFMLFLKINDEECPRTITPDCSKLNSPSLLVWEITKQIDKLCTVRVNSFISKVGHSATLLPSKNLTERTTT